MRCLAGALRARPTLWLAPEGRHRPGPFPPRAGTPGSGTQGGERAPSPVLCRAGYGPWQAWQAPARRSGARAGQRRGPGRSVAAAPGSPGRTTVRPGLRPRWSAGPGGILYRRSAYQWPPRDPAAAPESCDLASGPPPCMCASACGTPRSAPRPSLPDGGGAPGCRIWRADGTAHTRRCLVPAVQGRVARGSLCRSRQRGNMRLWTNDPYS